MLSYRIGQIQYSVKQSSENAELTRVHQLQQQHNVRHSNETHPTHPHTISATGVFMEESQEQSKYHDPTPEDVPSSSSSVARGEHVDYYFVVAAPGTRRPPVS